MNFPQITLWSILLYLTDLILPHIHRKLILEAYCLSFTIKQSSIWVYLSLGLCSLHCTLRRDKRSDRQVMWFKFYLSLPLFSLSETLYISVSWLLLDAMLITWFTFHNGVQLWKIRQSILCTHVSWCFVIFTKAILSSLLDTTVETATQVSML